MSYTIDLTTGVVTRDLDGVQVAPADSVDGPDFAAYAEWVSGGGVPIQISSEVRVVPQEVSMRQAQQALLQRGLLDTVEAVVAGAGRTIQIDWQKGQTVRRDWAALKVVQQVIHLSEEEIDDLFILAGSL